MIYGSVCSGIEAASVAWEPLGFAPAWFSEIEPFPSAVLSHHWPEVANLGDMTKIADRILAGEIAVPDVMVGGTPCQAFSVAGARKGLEDNRGFLTIKFVELADAIDQQRAANDNEPAVIVWENVPGVLSSKDNAFGAFLGLLAGEDCELQPPGRKWENAGYVRGPKRAIAWRVLDAQYFGLAQRRRRVFVVASARKDFDPSKVLFEREGVRRDTPPSREAGSVVAALTANGVGTCGADTGRGQPFAPVAFSSKDYGGDATENMSPTLRACGHADSHANAGAPPAVVYSVSLRGRDGGATAELGGEVSGCLRASSGGGDKPHVLAQTYPLLEVGKRTGTSTTDRRAGLGIGADGDPMFTLQAGAQHGVAVCVTGAVTHTLRAEGFDASEDGTGRGQPIVPAGMAVRRLMPVECERLQGFPDGHTDVPYRCKPAADGPRYKAIGNSMAVPVMRWIGQRIKLHLEAL